MNTKLLSSLLRSTGLIYAFDHLRFYYLRWSGPDHPPLTGYPANRDDLHRD